MLLVVSAMAAEYPAPDTYVITSKPSFKINVGDQSELLTCDAKLVLRTSEPSITAEGTRRVDLEVVNWEAQGTSELLGDVRFTMIKGEKTPDASFVVSKQAYDASAPGDFPALAQFALWYELETQYGKVANLYGLTQGEILSFPPRSGEIFTMEKGDTAQLMAALMPEPVSALSAAGEITPVNVSIRPADCACPVQE
jgi:hypothetical protein